MATKKRLIFALLYFDGYFCQSRNFQCQKVGNIDWLFNNYNFSKIARYLDELVVINVNPTPETHSGFLSVIERIVENVFIPVAIGGGIYNVDNAIQCFNSGADKVILNSAVRKNKEAVSLIVNQFGSQSVVAAIDYKGVGDRALVYDWEQKNIIESLDLKTYVDHVQGLQFGEILLNSVDRDGTGFGLDIATIESISIDCKLPLIVMGGGGKYEHFSQVYKTVEVDAVATANLLNFIGDSLPIARKRLLEQGIDLAKF
jgi:imidazole glycerol-phosphate synthase subunit HisF